MTTSRQDDRQQYTFQGRIQWKKILQKKKHWTKKATSWLTTIVHLGIGLCCATIWECAVGDRNKRSTNGHIMYAMIHPCLYLIQIVTEWGIYFEDKRCARTLDIYYRIRPLVCDDVDYFYSSTEKISALRLEFKTEDMSTTPHKPIWVGSLTTIHRASKCKPQVVRYLQCIHETNLNALNAWMRKKPKDCNSNGWYITR